MATLLLDTYTGLYTTSDPSRAGYNLTTYQRDSYTYDDVQRVVVPYSGTVSYTSGSGQDPVNYALPTTSAFDSYVVPPNGPGADPGATGKLRQVYHDGAGGLTYVDGGPPLMLTNLVSIAPVAPAATGSVSARLSGGTAPYAAYLVAGSPQTADGSGVVRFAGLAPGAYVLNGTDAAGGTVSQPFTISAAATLGCMTPRALNYDPAATQDGVPSLCEFVQVPTLPELLAAHLPIPCPVRASPTLAGLACIVVLDLYTADTLAGPWQTFAQLRRVCDTNATASFDLSEAAKSLLRIGLPVEAGPDSALSALLQVRYQVLDPLTLLPMYAGTLSAVRVLNAVVTPTAGALLTTASPYATLPPGGAQWTSTATLAGGVVTAAAPLPVGPCGARQFVWLNPAGAWDTGFFFGRHEHGTDQADPTEYRDTSGADRYARRGTVRATLNVYSDRLDWATYQAIRGVRNSVQVYERLGAGQYVAVKVATSSFQEYQEQTDKTFTVDFTVSYPAQLIQTQ